jgi:hypothetical protein
MFELLDDETLSPGRMPSSPIYRSNNSKQFLDDLLVLIAFGGLVLSEQVREWRTAQIAVWLVAAASGWWFAYRFVRRIEPIWRSDPTRRTRILIWSVLALLVVLIDVYAVAIKSETTVYVVGGISWGILILSAGVQYLRQRRRGESF